MILMRIGAKVAQIKGETEENVVDNLEEIHVECIFKGGHHFPEVIFHTLLFFYLGTSGT